MTKWRSLFYCQSWPQTAFMQTKHSREQRQNPVHLRGALLLRSDVLLFLSFWSVCSRRVLNVADTMTVDLKWHQSHITIRLINLRSAAALGFTHTQLLLRLMMESWCITAELWDGQQSQTEWSSSHLLALLRRPSSPDRAVLGVESPSSLSSSIVDWRKYAPSHTV